MRYNTVISGLFALFISYACDHGIAPEPEQTGISGTIYYKNWPPPVQIVNLKLIVFKEFPPGDIINAVMGGEAVVYPRDLATRLPLNVDSTRFLLDLEAGTYEYIVVAQQYGWNLYSDWRAVGQYDTTAQDSLPTSVSVFQDEILKDIHIYVDFDSLPIQPF